MQTLKQTHKEQTPEEWITEQFSFSSEEGAGVFKFRIEARHNDRERYRALVAVIRQKNDTPAAVFEKVDVQAARCQAPQVQVTAWMRQSTKQPVGIYNWPVEYESDEEEDDSDDDSKKGFDAAMYRQLARHNETLMATMMRNSQSTMMHLASQNERYEVDRERLMRERSETFDLYQSIRENDADSKLKSERWGKIGDTFKTLGEAAAFRLTQGKVAPDAQSGILLRSLGMLRESITPEQAAGLQQILSANQLTLLATLVTEPEEYAARSINPPETPPEAPQEPPAPPAPPPETTEPPAPKRARASSQKRSKPKKVAKRKTATKTA